jgi:hypothetical protein
MGDHRLRIHNAAKRDDTETNTSAKTTSKLGHQYHWVVYYQLAVEELAGANIAHQQLFS